MASTTPNIGLTLPTGAEKVSRQIINTNNTIIDSKIGAVPSGKNLQGEIDALNSKFTYKDYEIQFDGWSSGTIGTRAEQKQVSLENDISAYGPPVSATIKYITESSAAIYQAFLFNNLLMTNAYRASTNSMGSGYPIVVRVLFMKN